jgi:glutathione synthase/RimK-type ligase-like ATP-grasp enzyme
LDYTEPVQPRAIWSAGGDATVLTDATAVWWRRPRTPVLDGLSGDGAFGFAHGEWHEALHGMNELLSCPWMNPPACDDRASRKALQLRTAARLGLRVPDTLMTSDAAAATAFVERHGIGRTIYKIFTATTEVWRETRLLSADDLSQFESLRLAPVIFQEYIPAVADVRVTIVGRSVYAMLIHSRGTSYEVDFRVSLREATTTPTVLPDHVERPLLQMMDDFGLAYGAIDLRLTDDGDYVFLEINPAGEFLFCEAGAGLPLTDAVADWLADPVAPPPPRSTLSGSAAG